MALRIESAGKTDVGLVREKNEDSMLIDPTVGQFGRGGFFVRRALDVESVEGQGSTFRVFVPSRPSHRTAAPIRMAV